MDTRVTDCAEFVLLTDRWGNLNAHTMGEVGITQAEEDAVERLLDVMYDEFTFVARRKRDGAIGVLVEPREMPHAESDDGPEDIVDGWDGMSVNGKPVATGNLPSLADAIALLREDAAPVAEAYPGLDLSVVHGADVCACRAVVRAFVPEGSVYIGSVEAVTRRLLGEEPETAPAP